MLFKRIHLHATVEDLVRLEQVNGASFGPFVKAVYFFASPYSIDLEMEQYEKLLLKQSFYLEDKFGYILACCGGTDTDDDSFFQERVEAHMSEEWGGCPPQSDEKIRQGYDAYIECARRDNDLVCSGNLLSVWISALESFKNATHFYLRPPTTRSRGLNRYDPQVLLTTYLPTQKSEFFDQVLAVTGDLLFKVVIKCLSSTKNRIKTLEITCPLEETFGEERTDPGWDQLSLEHVERLSFGPRGHYDPERVDDHDERRRARTNRATVVVLKKAHRRLRRLKIAGDHLESSRTWPFISDLNFPKLREVHVTTLIIPTAEFTTYISRFVKLEKLKLVDCELGGAYGEERYKKLFETVREYPNRLHFLLRPLATDYEKFTFESKPAESTDDIELRYSGPKRKLALFLNKSIEWNDQLEFAFVRKWSWANGMGKEK